MILKFKKQKLKFFNSTKQKGNEKMETTKTNKSAAKRVNLTKTEFICLQVLLGKKGSQPDIILSGDSKNDYRCFFMRDKETAESVLSKGFYYLCDKLSFDKKVNGLRTVFSLNKVKANIDKAEKLLSIGTKIFLS